MSPDRVQLFTTAYKVSVRRGRWCILYGEKFSKDLFSKISKITENIFRISIATQLLSWESRRIFENIFSKSDSRRFFKNITFRKFPAIR